MKKVSLFLAVGLAFASSCASANTLTFQNVAFSTTNLGGGELQLTIDNALNAVGDWTGIKYLEAFSLSGVGTFTSASLSGWHVEAGGLSNGNGSPLGCDGHGSGSVCFNQLTTPVTLTNHMVFDIFFTGGSPNFSAPHLKVDFWAALGQTKSTGNLLSEDIVGTGPSPVPLPGALPLFVSGLVGLGLLGWRRKKAA